MPAIGPYELLGVLGEGGFATVYRVRATAAQGGGELALKALHPQFTADPGLTRRFLVEAEAMAVLSHPNIARVYDGGTAPHPDAPGVDIPYYTMELIDGVTLEELARPGGGLDPVWVADIMRALGSAVDYIHAAGLVHRDIKAANVMVAGDGRVVLMDFGIARLMDDVRHTRAGAFIGTPEATAPEQVHGQPVGRPADIYALGVLAYHLLTGRPPFTGDTGHVLHAHAYEPPPPLSAFRKGLPPHIDAAIAAALAKDPAARPATASTFAALLRGEGADTPASTLTASATAGVRTLDAARVATAARPARRAWLLPVAGLLVLLVVGGVAALALLSGGGLGDGGEARVAAQGNGSGGGLDGGASPAPSPAVPSTQPPATPAPRVTATAAAEGMSVCNSVFDCGGAEFRAGVSVVACFNRLVQGDGAPLYLAVTNRDQRPSGPLDAMVAGWLEVPRGSEQACHAVPFTRQPLPPGAYVVQAVSRDQVLAKRSFTALPPPTPSPTPSPTPTPIPTIRPTATPAPRAQATVVASTPCPSYNPLHQAPLLAWEVHLPEGYVRAEPVSARVPSGAQRPVAAQPQPPMRVFGNVGASDGVTITAVIGGTVCGTATASGGRYQVDVASAASRAGCGTDGATVSFRIGSLVATQTATFRTGAFVELNLFAITIIDPSPTPARTPTPAPTPARTPTPVPTPAPPPPPTAIPATRPPVQPPC